MTSKETILQKLGKTPPTRMLITGGEGMLGHSFATQAAQYFPHCEVRALGRDQLDVTNAKAMMEWSQWLGKGWLIHCAALVNVEGCASQPDVAHRTIVEGTRNAVALALESGAKLFYPQSFLTYDGATNPIPENEIQRPLSLYGQLKKEAEDYVVSHMPQSLRVRMAGFFGGEQRDKNFVGKIIPHLAKLYGQGNAEFAVGDRVWQPTLTDDLAFNSLVLILLGKEGAYQMASHGEASFADITQTLLEEFGWNSRIELRTVSAALVSKNELGKRPDRAVLSCTRLKQEGLDFQNEWKSSLKKYLSSPYFNQFR